MNLSSERQRGDLAGWLRRLIIASGYIAGACWLLGASLACCCMMLIELDHGISVFRTAFAVLPDFAWVAASMLLLSGTWGFQQHRRWGRTFLFAAAVLMIATIVGVHAIFLVGQVTTTYFGGHAGLRKANVIAGQFSMAVFQSLFAVLLILALRRPELTDSFPGSHRGFSPLFKSETPTPPIPVAPPEEPRGKCESATDGAPMHRDELRI
jgi:hypothetical protein